VPAVSGKGGANLGAFTTLVDAIRDATQGLTLREIIDHMLHASGLVDFYRTDKEGQDRIENLEELVNAAEAFVTQEGFGKDAVALPVDEQGLGTAPTPDTETGEIMSPLAAFLTHAALEAGDNQAQAGQDAIQLMTVHSAKGLEFDAVFITGIEEGLFPHENSLSDADGVEEERRLMYVAITRARQRLYLSFSQTRLLHGQTRYNVKSRFFDELPDHCLKWLSPRNAGFASGHAREYQNAWARGSGLGSIVGAGRVESAAPAFGAGPTTSSTGNGTGLRTGQSVFHAKFGEGVILTLEGRGADARAQINFGRHGTKWLALGIAKLTPID
jgi:DNA helicase-2/ATP-dependent DNA helicase PcrA